MSAGRRMSAERQRGQRQQRKQQVRRVARRASAAMGCTCGPLLEVSGGAVHVHCLHEAGCPLADFGKHYILWSPKSGGGR